MFVQFLTAHIIHVRMSGQINSCQDVTPNQTYTRRKKCRAWYLLHQIHLQFTLLSGWWPLFFHRRLPLTTYFIHLMKTSLLYEGECLTGNWTTRRFHTPLHPGPEWRIFCMSPLWVSYRLMMSQFPPFAFVESVSPCNKKNITHWLEDMNFMFSWQEQYLTRSLRSLVRYCSCHSNIKFITSRHRVISSIYLKHYMKMRTRLPK